MTKNGHRCRNMTDNHNELCWEHQNQDGDKSDDISTDNDESDNNENN